MRFARSGLAPFLLLAGLGCQPASEAESARAEILALHRSFIRAHLAKDAAFLARFASPGYLSVSDGRVEQMNASRMEAMLSDYLNSTTFSDYRDIADPIIGVSRDGSLAWAVVQVRVAGTRSLPDGASRQFDTRWAWITLYQREGRHWSRIVDVSTNRPFIREG